MSDDLFHAVQAMLETLALEGHTSPAARRLQFALDREQYPQPDHHRFWAEVATATNCAYRATLSKMLKVLFLVASDPRFAASHANAHSATARLRVVSQGLTEMATLGLVRFDEVVTEPARLHS